MKRQMGYTLIELIVVICVLSLTLGLTLPKVQNVVLLDQFEKTSRHLMILIRSLKQAAIADQKTYILHIDMSRNRYWQTDDSMSEEQLSQSEEKSTQLTSGVSFSKVTLPQKRAVSTQIADIHFYPKGYSDAVEIHLEGESRQRRLFVVEPFLSEVRISGEG
jgi:type II secretory pathway pseudopilin PulG